MAGGGRIPAGEVTGGVATAEGPMGFRTVGRVVAKWVAVPLPPDAGWGMPAPLVPNEMPRYYLQVAVLHPQTEQAKRRTVECLDEAQWERYPVGGWVRVQVRGAAPLLGVVGPVRIEE
jgi:hypothetical protein